MEFPLNLRLAFRNIFRNKVRSLITLAAISFGCISLIIAGGFFQDTFLRMREAVIHSHLGHIQIHRKGYEEHGYSKPFEYLIEDPEPIVRLLQSVPHVQLVTPRLTFSGLLSTGETTVSVIVQGVDPDGEKTLNKIKNVKGADTGLAIQAGRNLTRDDTFKIILGRGLAKGMEAKVGDPLILLSNTVEGAINALDLETAGIFYTASKEFDDRALRLPIDTAQQLLRTQAVETLVVLLDDTANTDLVAKQLTKIFHDRNLALELTPWYKMADFYNKTVTLYERQFLVLELIIAVIVVLSIFNTINMSIWERTREIGTIKALGYKTWEILRLFLMEGFLLGVIGGLIGVASGSALAYAISLVGIPMPPPPGATVGWTASIQIVPHILATSFFLAVFSSLISSFFPASKASRMIVAEALRHS